MKKKILIVEDQFIEANNLQMILERADYQVCGIARSVPEALEMVENNRPDMVLLDIFLRGNLTGIDLARKLNEKNIGFVFLSANSNQKTLDEAKVTRPYGFLVKPFREKDILVMLDIAWYRHEQNFAAAPGAKAVVPFPDTTDVPAFQHIIGNSGTLKKLLGTVLVVAPSDTSVLILGESGTGKERIAAAIHALSPKKGKPFVKVNCAALPATLIESELFGHERGAFTGAFEKRIGKFEQANGGTIFLDEIGEMPPETQVKLLRVLQEKEIERVGGSKTLKMDVRVIAATNRDLRERKEDIPVLADYFTRRFAKECGKNISNIAPPAMEKLLRYEWPGNIRELENQVERAVLMTNEPFITDFDLPVTKAPEKPTQIQEVVRPKTIDENERDHIISVLRKCNGKISGEGGAAEILQINVSTLNSRIKKHGIKKEHYFSVERK